MAIEQTVIWVVSAAFAPFMLLLFGTVILASCGKSLGLRQLYVRGLLAIFEWCQQRIKRFEDEERECDDEDEEDDGVKNEMAPPRGPRPKRPSRTSISYVRSLDDMKREFELSDAMEFAQSGIESIVNDEVTQRFSAEELTNWNLLTRTNRHNHYVSLRITVLWWIGCLVRYFVLLPFRISIAAVGIGGLIIGTAFIGYMPENSTKRWLNQYVSLMCFRIMARGFSAIITFHNPEYKACGGGICVANHTSPMDVVILATDNCYAMIGQSQGGFLGIMQRALRRATSHIWFERSEVRDRMAVAKRLGDHIADHDNLPILIFPEGTCINNTSVMMFKKGSFEVGGCIYPVAIKYDARFADAFWNSGKESMVQHILMIMSSWAIVCDVWYLPPCTKQDDENAIQFAYRVKRQIAEQGGLVDLEWDGQLKRSRPKESYKEKKQREYSNLLKAD